MSFLVALACQYRADALQELIAHDSPRRHKLSVHIISKVATPGDDAADSAAVDVGTAADAASDELDGNAFLKKVQEVNVQQYGRHIETWRKFLSAYVPVILAFTC
jgi:hypothetical protein